MDLTSQIRGAALVLLGQREHSRRELLSKLADKFNLPVDAIELQQCLARLAKDGYQSDERFAEVFVRSQQGAWLRPHVYRTRAAPPWLGGLAGGGIGPAQ
jgi:regulatory protein